MHGEKIRDIFILHYMRSVKGALNQRNKLTGVSLIETKNEHISSYQDAKCYVRI